MTETVRDSVFTPTGALFCWACHGPTWHTSDRPVPDYAARCVEVERPTDPDEIGTCDRCNAEVRITRTDVALCQRAVTLLREDGFDNAELWQTGGMCVAVGIPWGEGEDAIYVFADAETRNRYAVQYLLGDEEVPPSEREAFNVHLSDLVATVNRIAGVSE